MIFSNWFKWSIVAAFLIKAGIVRFYRQKMRGNVFRSSRGVGKTPLFMLTGYAFEMCVRKLVWSVLVLFFLNEDFFLRD